MFDESKIITYNKLVRDKIPEIIERSGKTCLHETLPDEQYLRMLNEKLVEEVNEYLACVDIEELADIEEVIKAILSFKRISSEAFEKICIDKREKRGGFQKRILLKQVFEK